MAKVSTKIIHAFPLIDIAESRSSGALLPVQAEDIRETVSRYSRHAKEAPAYEIPTPYIRATPVPLP